MRRLPSQLLASIPISTRRAAASAALSLRLPPSTWRTHSNGYSGQVRLDGLLLGPLHSVTTLSRSFPSSSSSPSSSTTPSSSSASQPPQPETTDSPPSPDELSSSSPSSSSSPHPSRTADNPRPPQPRPHPFRFETGIAVFAKRPPRPFPPPFLSAPSGSFSDPLSTHEGGRRSGPVRGRTNGDDAVYAGEMFICANDGVGAWSTRPRGNAGLWARLILHYWVAAMQEDATRPRQPGDCYVPDPVEYLQRAYEQTIEATSPPNDWLGTTTACGAQLHYQKVRQEKEEETAAAAAAAAAAADGEGKGGQADKTRNQGGADGVTPLLYVASLGDSQVMVVRPSDRSLVFKTTEQWHWFDCPRQLGTNSPDTPRANAVVDAVPIREGDVVLAMTDGVIDNLWAHEIVENVSDSVARWEAGEGLVAGVRAAGDGAGEAARRKGGRGGGMKFVAEELMEAAKTVALDPFAESPFMEHAIEEGLASEGGKLDDISVVAALCTRRET